jgi:ADP-ribose pyrophosphatase
VKIKDKKTVYDGFFKVESLTLEHDGKLLKRDLITARDAVAALVFDTVKQEYILIEQYRLPAQKPLIEIVAGLLDKENEKPEEAITREIEEEIGYAVDSLEPITNFYSTPGSNSEKIWLFYAEVSRKIGQGGGVATEDENIKTVCFSEKKLFQSNFEDGKTLIAVLWQKCKART